MTTSPDTTVNTSAKNKRAEHLSPDGKWRTFPKVPNLLQYVSTGVYFARVKVSGKLIRRSLETDVFTTAKLKLADFVKKERQPKVAIGTMGAALKVYLRTLTTSHDVSDQTKRYRRFCVRALLKTWPGLRQIRVDAIRPDQCSGWASKFASIYDEQYFNNTLAVLRSILAAGGLGKDSNPALKIKRLGVKPPTLDLPERLKFQQIVQKVESAGARQSKHCADLIRFLAFSGCRISEARAVTWAHVDFARGEISVRNAKQSKKSNSHAIRTVPMIPPMRELLEKLRSAEPKPMDRVCLVGDCEKSLTNACEKVGASRLTHHDLRHLFATRCIEAGVDIPTISRWLGHQDGGALAMRVYGHLQREHSASMAKKVTFAMSGTS